MKTRKRSKLHRSAAPRTRQPSIEPLEMRACPAVGFTYGGIGGDGCLTFNGTQNDDVLLAIYANGGKIWFETVEWSVLPLPLGSYNRAQHDTQVDVPDALNTICISINGLAGDDEVDLWASSNPAWKNLIGVPPNPSGNTNHWPVNSVTQLKFFGGDGDDKFNTPDAVTNWGGAVIRPAPGGTPNIIFYGGVGEDTLHNNNDPEYFEGEPGPDKSLVAAGKGGGQGRRIKS